MSTAVKGNWMRSLLKLSFVILVATVSLHAQGIGGSAGIGGKAGIGGGVSTTAPATFINSGSCAGSVGAASCTVTPGTAIPSGSIIFVLNAAPSTGQVSSVSDSNSDSSTCGTQTQETTDGFTLRLCRMTAGASVTTVTCTISNFASSATACAVAWYSPGSLTGVTDQTTAQDQPNTTTWTSGNTSTLSGSNDLVVGAYVVSGTSTTSTYSDGSTQRISFNCSAANAGSCAIADRNVTGTTAVAATGTWSGASYGVAGVMAIK
jgi:hypothetical protein